MFESIQSILKGINAINVTPFDEQLEIDWESLKRNVNFLVDHGIKAIYPCGNTGEFYALTLKEAKEVTQYVTEVVAKRSLVIAGVGYDAKTACELADNAEQAGADGIMVHQPVHPYILSAGMVAYYKQIASSTKLPMILYIRSEQITHEVLAEVSELPNVIAVKYAVNHPPSFRKAVEAVKKDIVWICGTAEMWAPTFYAAGAQGFTSGMVNVDTKRSFAMMEALNKADYPQAMAVWSDILPFEELRETNKNGNNVSVVKEAMYQLGLISSNAVRPPIALLQEKEIRRVTELLKSWGLKQE
jgi:4-hydroxy-tetrahydrodipicolinate synthase